MTVIIQRPNVSEPYTASPLYRGRVIVTTRILRSLRFAAGFVAGALVVLSADAQTAQATQEARPSEDAVPVTSQRLRPDLHVLMSGRNGNVGVWTGIDGIVVVDDSLAPLAPRVLATRQNRETSSAVCLSRASCVIRRGAFSVSRYGDGV